MMPFYDSVQKQPTTFLQYYGGTTVSTSTTVHSKAVLFKKEEEGARNKQSLLIGALIDDKCAFLGSVCDKHKHVCFIY